MQSAKCVLVGDMEVGKTYLLYTYIHKVFPKEYVPAFFQAYSSQVNVDGQTVTLNIFQTSGNEHYQRLRSVIYPQANVVIICFSIANPTSYENVKLRWLPEVRLNLPNVPILLLGTKSDLRDDQDVLQELREQDQAPVTEQQGTALAKEIEAVKYLECTSINLQGLDEAFDEAARVFLNHSASTNKPCVLM